MRHTQVFKPLLAFAVLVACMLAYARPDTVSWWWVPWLAVILAILTLADPYAWLADVRRAPLSIQSVAAIARDVLLPVVLLVATILAALSTRYTALDIAVVLAVTLACITLIRARFS